MTGPRAHPDGIEELYDARYAGDYMGVRDSFFAWSRQGIELRRVTQTLQQVPPAEISSILDYGCGSRGWVPLLSTLFPKARVTGIDVSRTAVREANARYPEARFLPFDGAEAPFAAASFDLVFSYHVLEHVAELEVVVDEMARLLKVEGYLCLIFPCANEGSLEEWVTRQVRDGKEPSPDGYRRFFFEDPSHLRRLESREIVRLFAKHQLTIKEQWFANHLFGAIERISRLGYGYVKRHLESARPVGPGAALRLHLLRYGLALIAVPVHLSLLDLRQPRSALKQGLLYALMPIRILGSVFRKLLERLAFREWESRKRQPHGSAQYLVLQKRV
jgi:SAM-dependent methyltransferase